MSRWHRTYILTVCFLCAGATFFVGLGQCLNQPILNFRGGASVPDSSTHAVAHASYGDDDVSAVVGRDATPDEIEQLNTLMQQFLNQNSDNPGSVDRELNAVRTELIRLKNAGVAVTMDPLKYVDDRSFKKAVLKKLEYQVAANGGSVGHAILVCMSFVVSHFCGGPGPIRYPELSIEARRQIEVTISPGAAK